jgi:hypothetical protein
VELYFPSSEYDLETISSVLFSFVSLVLIALMTIVGCFPESKISAMFFDAAIRKTNPSAAKKATVLEVSQVILGVYFAICYM